MTINPVVESAGCCSCGACFSICPQDAICFKVTNIGRKYAVINDNCIDCGLCSKACPILNPIEKNIISDNYIGNIHSCYVGKSLDQRIFENAQSGGMCTTVLKHLFDNKKIDAAVVTYMDEGEVPKVHGQIVTSVDQLYDSQKSCYTMVDVLSALKDTSSYYSVAVVGLPCQIHAVHELCKTSKKYGNIKYKLGLVCDRTLCSLIQEVMIDLSNAKGKSVKINWRQKKGSFNNQEFNYQNAPITITSEGRILSVLSRENRLGLKDFFTPPCCHKCTDKLSVYADLVFGDPWGVKGIDSRNGESLVISRTNVGDDLIARCVDDNYAEIRVANINEVIKGQKIEQKRKYTLEEINKKITAFLENEKLDTDLIIRKSRERLDKEILYKKSINYKLMMTYKRIIKKIFK